MKIAILVAVAPLYFMFMYLLWIMIKEVRKDSLDDDYTGIREKLPPCYGAVEARTCFKSKDDCFECMMNCLDRIEELVDEDTKGRK